MQSINFHIQNISNNLVTHRDMNILIFQFLKTHMLPLGYFSNPNIWSYIPVLEHPHLGYAHVLAARNLGLFCIMLQTSFLL